MSFQKLIDFGIIPIDSFEVSSNADGFKPSNVFDGNLTTTWKPVNNQPNNFYQINFTAPHLVKAFDIAFGQGDKRKYTFIVEALNTDGHWVRVNVYQTKGNTNEPVRVNIPDVMAKSIKYTFKSYEEANHTGTDIEVAELRVYGLTDENEIPGKVTIPELGCPEGYVLDVSTGRCIKDVEFQILVPNTIEGKPTKDAEGNTDALLDIATDIAYTIRGKDSQIIEKFEKPVQVNAINLEIQNKGIDYSFVVNIPNKVQIPVLIQKGINQTSFILQESVVTDTIELLSQNDELVLIDFYGLGTDAISAVEPPKPTEGRKQEKGANQDAKKWVATEMKKPVENWTHKVVDENNVNEADQFTSLKNAQDYINYYIWKQGQEGGPTEPTDPTGPTDPVEPGDKKYDKQGVLMLYATKVGGQVVNAEDTYQKESEHNTGTRTSLYSKVEYKANSGEITEGFIMDLSDNGEQNAPKTLSGGHTGSGESNETKQGQCYAIGINQNGSLHLAKEYPYHNITPKAYQEIKYISESWKSLGDIKNKLTLMKIIYHPVTSTDGKKGMHIEWWFDKKGCASGKLENDWQQMAYADDFGNWGGKYGPPHMENNGVKYKGKVLGFYIRIDTPKKPVKFSYQGQREIGENPVRLV